MDQHRRREASIVPPCLPVTYTFSGVEMEIYPSRISGDTVLVSACISLCFVCAYSCYVFIRNLRRSPDLRRRDKIGIKLSEYKMAGFSAVEGELVITEGMVRRSISSGSYSANGCNANIVSDQRTPSYSATHPHGTKGARWNLNGVQPDQ